MIMWNLGNDDFDRYKCYLCGSALSNFCQAEDVTLLRSAGIDFADFILMNDSSIRFYKCNCEKSTKSISDGHGQISIRLAESRVQIFYSTEGSPTYMFPKMENINVIDLEFLFNGHEELSLYEYLKRIDRYSINYNGSLAFK